MIISRFEIKFFKFIPFSYGVLYDGFTKRGFLYAEIAIGGKLNGTEVEDYATLHLFTTHLQSTHFEPIEKGYEQIKNDISCRVE